MDVDVSYVDNFSHHPQCISVTTDITEVPVKSVPKSSKASQPHASTTNYSKAMNNNMNILNWYFLKIIINGQFYQIQSHIYIHMYAAINFSSLNFLNNIVTIFVADRTNCLPTWQWHRH